MADTVEISWSSELCSVESAADEIVLRFRLPQLHEQLTKAAQKLKLDDAAAERSASGVIAAINTGATIAPIEETIHELRKRKHAAQSKYEKAADELEGARTRLADAKKAHDGETRMAEAAKLLKTVRACEQHVIDARNAAAPLWNVVAAIESEIQYQLRDIQDLQAFKQLSDLGPSLAGARREAEEATRALKVAKAEWNEGVRRGVEEAAVRAAYTQAVQVHSLATEKLSILEEELRRLGDAAGRGRQLAIQAAIRAHDAKVQKRVEVAGSRIGQAVPHLIEYVVSRNFIRAVAQRVQASMRNGAV